MTEDTKPKLFSREYIHTVIFGVDTPAGRLFDVVLLGLIVLSVMVVLVESTVGLSHGARQVLYYVEWSVTIIFTIEYFLRIYCLRKPSFYIFSFYGLIDLFSILPSYIALVYTGAQALMVFRILRLLRVFRILRLSHFVSASEMLVRSIRASLAKILVFMLFVLLLVTILGSVMYLIEGRINPNFSSIPKAIYWAIVTLTTVGYGDITPVTAAGQFISTVVMLLGYSIIAVPTGIISAEMSGSRHHHGRRTIFHAPIHCPKCGNQITNFEARYCDRCGTPLPHIFNHSHKADPISQDHLPSPDDKN